MNPSVVASPSADLPIAAKAPASGAVRARRRRWLRLAAVLAVLAAAAVAWRRLAAARPLGYVTAPVTRGPMVRSVIASGTVNPVLTIIVGSYVSGVIQALYCDFNTRVKRGQICAKIDPRPYQTVVDQDKADLETAVAQLAKDQANVVYARLSYARNLSLLRQGMVSQDTLDQAKNAIDEADAQVGVDRATIDQRRAELNAAEINLGYTDITSPVDGVVVSRNVTMGETVAASFQTPTLFLIATDLTKMEVDTNVSESDIGAVREGDPAVFTVEAYPDRPFQGVVSQIRQSPQTLQNVVTYDVVVSVDNPDLRLMPGMTATLRIAVEQRAQALRVPDQALRYTPGGLTGAGGAGGAPRVWTLRGGRPVAHTVTTGLDDDAQTEIVQGDLKPGDEVIVADERPAPGGTGSHLPTLHF